LAAGIVSFAVRLDGHGNIQSVDATRDFPPLTRPAQAALQHWNFAPATLHGEPVPSSISVGVIFNVFDPSGLKWKGLTLTPPAALAPDALHFKPAEITSASFADYPSNSVSQGTVVLDVTVGSSGKLERIRVILGEPPLTSAAMRTVKDWTFTPATFQGRAISSHLAVAFVMQINNPIASPTD
jgi:TonB family protein